MTTIQLRRGTTAEWTAANPILAAGEAGIELDTDRHKLGDGVRPWSALPYFLPESKSMRVTHPNVDDVLVQAWDAGKGRWQAIYYDSGIREISGLLINGWVKGSNIFAMRRSLQTLRIWGDPRASGATVETLINGANWPPGFGVAAGANSVGTSRDTSTGAVSGVLLGYGLLYYGAIGAGTGTILFRVETEATEVLPTSLPGTLYQAAQPFALVE